MASRPATSLQPASLRSASAPCPSASVSAPWSQSSRSGASGPNPSRARYHSVKMAGAGDPASDPVKRRARPSQTFWSSYVPASSATPASICHSRFPWVGRSISARSRAPRSGCTSRSCCSWPGFFSPATPRAAPRRHGTPLAFMLLLFACVVAHEFGHIFMATAVRRHHADGHPAADRRCGPARTHPGKAVGGVPGRDRRTGGQCRDRRRAGRWCSARRSTPAISPASTIPPSACSTGWRS